MLKRKTIFLKNIFNKTDLKIDKNLMLHKVVFQK